MGKSKIFHLAAMLSLNDQNYFMDSVGRVFSILKDTALPDKHFNTKH